MIRRLPILLAAIAVVSPALADELACAGALGPDSSEARLIQTYGKDNVVTGDVEGAEGEIMLATTVFPNDEAKKFQVGWWNEDKREQLAYFTVPAGDTAPGGVRAGQSVAEVEALNGEPFTLYGFYWDYGGAANFTSGKLSQLPGGCSLSVTFQPTATLPEGTDDDAVVGDKEVPSTEPLLARLAAKVSDLYLSYPDPNADEEDSMGEDGGEAQ